MYVLFAAPPAKELEWNEQGVDGILMNTAIAAARDPVAMAHAMRPATESGRAAYLAGRMPRREIAVPSSPSTGMLQ
jgi:thiazole synthase